jgi:hypothetical protein
LLAGFVSAALAALAWLIAGPATGGPSGVAVAVTALRLGIGIVAVTPYGRRHLLLG